jgi:membrane associated rhomboid family serine protease
MDYGFPQFTRGIRALVVVTTAVWILQLLPGVGAVVSALLDLTPFRAFGHLQLWRIVTYAFCHDTAGPFHILFNMFTLWMFGAEIEDMWGTRRFVVFYLCAAAGSALFSLAAIFSPVMWYTPVIGASGAVIALLTVYALYFPRRQILLFFLFPVNVVAAVVIFGAISLLGAVHSWGNVSHLTHLGGIAVGFAYVKGFPLIARFFENAREKAENSRREAAARKEAADKEHFQKVIDPILAKISRTGMESLTPEEKRALDEASKRKKGNRDGSDKIVPFDRGENR